jgi:hypothetical protein
VGLALGLAVPGILVGGSALASIPTTGSHVIYACRSIAPGSGAGTLRVIDYQARQRCRTSERLVSWNASGVRGATGPVGGTGAPGPTGVAGPKGDPGAPAAAYWARVSGNGAVTASSGGVTVAHQVLSSSYVVTFPADVSQCAALAQPYQALVYLYVSPGAAANSIAVGTESPSGSTSLGSEFALAVYC